MPAWDAAAARRYHRATKLTYLSVAAAARPLDWRTAPSPFKLYRGLETLPLPSELRGPDVPVLDVLAVGEQPVEAGLDLAGLARILSRGAGVVGSRRFPDGETYHFRAYSSAGALYPLELYVACTQLPDLEAGVYHFDPRELVLGRTRATDARACLAQAAGEPALLEAGAVLVVTGIMSRSAWKYGARAYRHVFWDAGTMLANLLALASSARLGPHLLTAFADREVDDLLGIDGELETSLALLAIGRAGSAPPTPQLDPVPDSEPIAPGRRYPEAIGLRAASRLQNADDARAWRAASTTLAHGSSGPVALARPTSTAAIPRDPVIPSPAPTGVALSRDPVDAVIRRRGSAREFALEAIPVAEAAAILARAAGPLPADIPPLTGVYVAAHALDGLAPGAYAFTPPDRFEPTRRGNLRRAAGHACLGQPLGATSAATAFLMVDLERVLETLGSRGYHAASLDAGVRTGRIYLGAYAQRLGATGLAFYDDEASELVAPGTRLAPMMSFAIGVDGRRRGLRRHSPSG